MRLKMAMVWACCALFADCTATETGNPVAEQHMALTARSSDDTVVVGAPTMMPHTRIKQAWVVLGDIRFIKAAQCDADSAEPDIEGPIVVELVWKPKAFDFSVEDTDYCRMHFPLRLAKAPLGDAPVELEDHSILIKGVRADDTPFLLRSRLNSEADVRSPDGRPFRLGNAVPALILAFDLGRWLDGIDLDALEPGSDGTILIDEDHEQAQLEAFEHNVNVAMELYRDQNQDGALDPNEAKAPLASGGP